MFDMIRSGFFWGRLFRKLINFTNLELRNAVSVYEGTCPRDALC